MLDTLLTFVASFIGGHIVWRIGRRLGRAEGFRVGYEAGCRDAFSAMTKKLWGHWAQASKNLNKEN